MKKSTVSNSLKLLAGVCLGTLSMNVAATPLYIEGGNLDHFTLNNVVTLNQNVNFGGILKTNSNAEFTFTFIGKDAQWTNDFLSGENSILDLGTFTTRANTLEFTFESSGQREILNQNNSHDFMTYATVLGYTHPGFDNGSVSEPSMGTYYDALILLDDGGGRGDCVSMCPDADYNDLIIGVNVSVPEPATFVLFGLALFGLGSMRKRKS